jgi:hypothetical protein
MIHNHLLSNILILLIGFCCSGQIVNEGVLHISDATNVYFENEFINKKGAVFNNQGTVYCNSSFKNNGTVQMESGHIYYKCAIKRIKVIGLNNVSDVFKLSTSQNNKVTYLGHNARKYQINVNSTILENKEMKPSNYVLIHKNSSGIINTSKISQSIISEVAFATHDFIEIWKQRTANDSMPVIDELSLNFMSD